MDDGGEIIIGSAHLPSIYRSPRPDFEIPVRDADLEMLYALQRDALKGDASLLKSASL